MKVIHDGGLQPTERSIDFFRKHRKKLGRILRVVVDGRIDTTFHMEIVGTKATMLLSGCTCGYRGTGPHGTVEILKLAGVEFDEQDIFTRDHVQVCCK